MKSSARLLFAVATLAVASSVNAAPKTWSSTTGGDWATGVNWGGVVPVTGDSLTFGGTTAQTLTNTLTNNTFDIAGITFNGTGAYTLGGNEFRLTGAIVDTASSG